MLPSRQTLTAGNFQDATRLVTVGIEPFCDRVAGCISQLASLPKGAGLVTQFYDTVGYRKSESVVKVAVAEFIVKVAVAADNAELLLELMTNSFSLAAWPTTLAAVALSTCTVGCQDKACLQQVPNILHHR